MSPLSPSHPAFLEDIKSIARRLAKIGRKTYIVGSFCVNTLEGRSFTGDIDLTTDA